MTTRRPGGQQQIPRPDIYSDHPEVPWGEISAWDVDALAASVIATPTPLTPSFPDARLSAVLIALFQGPDGAEVLLTRRGMSLRNHGGEISFPGGRMDPGETPIETALRESFEEVGLDPALPRIVGELPHVNTIVSRSYIVPIVSVLPERPQLQPLTAEVDRVLWTTIEDLTSLGTYHLERWGRPPLDRPLHFFELDDETVWGATAHMLVELLVAATT